MNRSIDVDESARLVESAADAYQHALLMVIGCERTEDPGIKRYAYQRQDLIGRVLRNTAIDHLREFDTARQLELARNREQLARDIDGLKHQRTAARSLYRYPDLAREVGRARDSARVFARRIDDLTTAVEQRRIRDNLANPPAPLDRHRSAAGAQSPQSANNLLRIAVRALPAGNRQRYEEEFRSELHDLATEGASAWQQIIYALRLADRALILRAEVRQVTKLRARR